MTDPKMTGHTPGPWTVDVGKYGNNRVRVTHGAGTGIATIHALIHQKDNAHLIAAAPDLLDAVRAFLDPATLGAEAVIQARAAIAKAKGKAND